jgi:hypothetical protein
MKTLMEILTGTLDYSSQWGIYAERRDGKFQADSPARYGQRQFENGGLLDEKEYFLNNESATDHMSAYLEGVDEPEDWQLREAAQELIAHINEQASQN